MEAKPEIAAPTLGGHVGHMTHEGCPDQEHHHFYPVGEREPRGSDQEPGDGGDGGGGSGGQSLIQRQRSGE